MLRSLVGSEMCIRDSIYEGSEPCVGSGCPSGVRFTAHFLREVKLKVGCQCCPVLIGGSVGPLGLCSLVMYEGSEPCLGSGYTSCVRFTAHFLGEGQFRVRCQCCPALLGGLVGPLGLCSLVIYEGSEPCLGSGYPSGVRFTAHFLGEGQFRVRCQCCPALLGRLVGPLGLCSLVIYEGS